MKTVLVLITICIYFFSFGQEKSANVTWGPEYITSKNIGGPRFLGSGDGKYFVLSSDYKFRYLETYNQTTYAKEKSIVLNDQFKNKNLGTLDVVMYNNRPTFLLAKQDSIDAKIHYFLQAFNSDLEPLPLKEVGTRNFDGPLFSKTVSPDQLAWFYYERDLLFSLSTDGAGLVLGLDKGAIVNGTMPSSWYEKPISSNLELIKINSDFEVEQKQDFKIPFEKFTPYYSDVTKNNELIMVGSEDTTVLIRNVKHTVSKGYYLIRKKFDTGELQVAKLTLDSFKIGAFRFAAQSNGDVHMVGSIVSEESDLLGTFFMHYSSDLELIDKKLEIFDEDFKLDVSKANMSTKKEKNAQEEKAYWNNKMVHTSDGGLVLLLEPNFSFSTNYMSNGGQSMSTASTSVCGNIIAVKYDRSGNLAWKRVIHKCQLTYVGASASYFVTEYDNEIYFLFNEYQKDLIDPYLGSEMDNKGSNVIGSFVKIDASGQLTKEKIFEFPASKDMVIKPWSCTMAEEDCIFIFVELRSAFKMGRLKL